ncbi:MAG: rod shape-determining protein RodA [Planctomycetes bacterium]|nr:rod shape-determining protein RodA [Planctomycetota bacterium]MCW8136336.1 rod shape-determining protein RodA [Planctomycetota bacterium]
MRIRQRIRNRVSLLRSLPLAVILPALLLVGAGIAFIYSASSDFELLEQGMVEARDFHVRQAAFAILGFMLMLVVALLPARWLTTHWYAFLALGLLMLGAVLVFGRTVNGAKSWIMFGPFGLQPSELCKPLLIVALAGYLRYHQSVDSLGAFGACLGICGAFLLPIMLQPDLGTALVFMPVVAAMVWTAGGNRVYLGSLAAIGLSVIPAAYLTGMLKDHQMKRIDIYLSSLSGEVADRSGDGYQVMQSMTAVGSGGLTGEGFGAGTQSQLAFLPERHNDFIFAVISQETGLIGVAVFFAIMFFMITRIMRLGYDTREPFARLVVVGVATLFFAQAAINVGVVSGFIPVTGITLPLVSYGGSSLLSGFASLGLVSNVAIQPIRVMGKATF